MPENLPQAQSVISPQSPTMGNIAPAEERWYLPSFTETLRLMRWRVIYFLPAIAFFLLALAACFQLWLLQVFIYSWKLVIFAVALPLAAAARTARNAIRLRTEPFCIHCGYNLTGLPDGHLSPECGIQFQHAVIDDYRRDPHWFIKRYRTQHPAAQAFDAGPRRSPKRRDGT